MQAITFPEPVLFLEFFERIVSYYGPDRSAKFPPGTLFYKGESKAVMGHLSGNGKRTFWQSHQLILPRQNSFGFFDGKPCVLATQKRYFLEFLETNPLDALICKGYESWHDEGWVRERDSEACTRRYPDFARCAEVVNLTPYRFNIWLQDESGNLLTDFPDSEVRQTLEVGSTYLFLARQEQYERNGSWQIVTPNINLCLFVKNHGLHREIRLVSESEFASYDIADLCKEPYRLRDHRKSRFKYMLG
jgi:hypothetical protein